MSIRRILFFDFDDTLYSHALGKIPERALARIQRLDRTETLVAVVTGRGPESADLICSALGFLPTVLALLNGQLIWEEGRQVSEHFMELASMDRILRRAKAHGFAYGGYCRRGEVVSCVNSRVAAVWKRFGCPIPEILSPFDAACRLYQGHLYITRGEASLFAPLLEDYLVNWSDEYLMNLIPKTAGKSRAVAWCLARWPCARENTYAFGDGFNDVDLLSSVGHGVALGAGSPALLAAAELCVPSAEENGLAAALEHYHI